MPSARSAAATPPSVEAFLAALEHPQKPAILALRTLILGAAPGITEHVKWNAPSFRTTEDFATFHLRARHGVQLVLHLGPKPRPDSSVRRGVADPAGLLTWKGPDRAVVILPDLTAVEAQADVLQALVRQWITFLD